jgi:hypothetical protein
MGAATARNEMQASTARQEWGRQIALQELTLDERVSG